MASTSRQVIVIADGELDEARLSALFEPRPHGQAAPLVIAADGAAAKALDAGVRPDIVIGDGDSLAAHERARLMNLGIELRLARADKDESDTELCLLAALAIGATEVTIVGALGGDRPEHAIANLLLLADERFDHQRLWLVAGTARMTRIGTEHGPGAISVHGQPGDYVSLFALGGRVDGVSTAGLRFPLDHEQLSVGPSRGLSNELLTTRADITTVAGRLLVVHTAREPGAAHPSITSHRVEGSS